MPLRLREELVDVPMTADRDYLVVIAEVMNDIERVAADRSSRSENGNPFGQARQLYSQPRSPCQSREADFSVNANFACDYAMQRTAIAQQEATL